MTQEWLTQSRVVLAASSFGVLIVENEPGIASVVRAYVNYLGHWRVAIAHDVDGAVASLQGNDIAVAFVDLHLPGRSTGYEVADQLTRHGVGCVLIAGAAPAFPMPELALGYVLKPLKLAAIRMALKAAEGHCKSNGSDRKSGNGFVAF